MKRTIIVLRGELDEIQKTKLAACFPAETEFEFVRTDSRDYREHAAKCRVFQPAAVILPMEQPIPSLAMKDGFVHVAFLPDGTIGQLEPLQPKFTPFSRVYKTGSQADLSYSFI